MLFFEMVDKFLDEWRTRDEHFIQGTAFAKLMSNMRTTELELALIARFGAEFRDIINDFKYRYKSLPSSDDLIWIAGVHAGKDPRDIVKDIATQIRKNK